MSFVRPSFEQLQDASAEDRIVLFANILQAASTDEIAIIAAGSLARLPACRQPLELFNQFARLVTLSTVEMTPFRSTRNHKVEVLLGQRDDDDSFWPGLWHLPGNVQVPTGVAGIRSYDDATDDILQKEFRGTIARTGPVAFCEPQLRTGERGSEQTVFVYGDVDLAGGASEPYRGKFFDAEKVLSEPPAEGMIRGHDLNIARALRLYRQDQA